MSSAVSPSSDATARPARAALVVRLALFAVLGPILIVAIAANDIALFAFLQAHLSSTLPTGWSMLTILGSGAGMLAAVSPLWKRRPQLSAAVLTAAALCGLAVQVVKRIWPLPRPLSVLGENGVQVIGLALHNGSFPSGHSATAFACAAVLIASGIARGPWRLAVLVAAAAIALSRVVVGAHWPSDIAAGALVGWVSGLAAHALAQKMSARVHRHLQWITGVVLLGCSISLLVVNQGYPLALWFERGLGVFGIVIVAWAAIERLPAFKRRERS
jgi:membrane-associated phospholipid phosphatase